MRRGKNTSGGSSAAAGSLNNTDPRLGQLASNGGSTQTHAIGLGSAAINAGNATICATGHPTGPGGVDQ